MYAEDSVWHLVRGVAWDLIAEQTEIHRARLVEETADAKEDLHSDRLHYLGSLCPAALCMLRFNLISPHRCRWMLMMSSPKRSRSSYC